MAKEVKLSKEEAKWRAEDDARTLQLGEVIRNDPKRLKKAIDAAKRLADEKRKEADAIAKVASGQLFYKSMNK